MLKLRQNMQLHRNEINAEFATWLGHSSYDPTLNGCISLPSLISQVPEMSGLYEQVFPQAQMYTAHKNPEFLDPEAFQPRSMKLQRRWTNYYSILNAERPTYPRGW